MILYLTIDEADQAEREVMRREVEGLESLARQLTPRDDPANEPEAVEPARLAA